MAVRIEASEGAKLKLSGDIERVVGLPLRAVREGFTLAFSDGSLVSGDFDYGSQSCRFQVEIEGAAELKIIRTGGVEALEVGWPTEWISIAAGDDTLQSATTAAHVDGEQLMLGIEQRQAA